MDVCQWTILISLLVARKQVNLILLLVNKQLLPWLFFDNGYMASSDWCWTCTHEPQVEKILKICKKKKPQIKKKVKKCLGWSQT